MRIGIPKEPAAGQKLVSASPDTVAKLIKLGYEVCVESGAGVTASYLDAQYEASGARIVGCEEAWGSDIITCLDTPPADKLALIKRGAILIGRMNPWASPADIETFKSMGITALAMDAVPRISRAQSLDVRSSMMNVGGYRAVIEAANAFGRTFAGQVTAAGKTHPAKVYIIGVGVAGLSAIGTAESMGAQVFATDVRPEVADQVESLGATFVEIPVKQDSTDGYAKELTAEQEQLTLEVYTKQCGESDIVITTAAVPGRPAPLLVTEEAVANMKPGSVIVDMGASELGGNCSLSKPDEIVVTQNGVTIIGYTDLPGHMPAQSSQLYGQNMVNFIKLCTPQKDGQLVLNEEDEVVRGVTVTLNGEGMWPPPEVKVSAEANSESSACANTNTADTNANKSETQASTKTTTKEKSTIQKHWWKVVLAAVLIALIFFAPQSMQTHFTVFALACVVGFYVITNVTHSLHTPLMSETNAISGIIVVGAILEVVSGLISGNMVVVVLSAIAVAVASINIFGGFLVTRRMLKMFERSSE